jgi:hypothetical protein
MGQLAGMPCCAETEAILMIVRWPHGAHQDAQKLIQRMEFQRLGICIESRQ